MLKQFLAKFMPGVNVSRVTTTNQCRVNALTYADPDTLSRAITSFRAGNLRDLSKIIDEFEDRDDITRASSRKAYTAISRCPHQILIREGEEDNPRAKLHQEILTKFWATVQVQDIFARNAIGGMRLLKKNMSEALSRVWSVHEVVWRPQPDGTLQATFTKIPLWYFENRTGVLRYLPTDLSIDGLPLDPGGWLIAQGDGVGIAAAVAAMSKRLSLQDWLLYSERCGQPGLHAKTNAQQGSPAWEGLVNSVAAFGREWQLVTSKDVEMEAVSLHAQGSLPYPELISRMDRVIAALYRGADLSTISADGNQAGASVQGDETRMLDADVCEMVGECLQQQIEPFVIQWVTGDSEPLAYIDIAPASNPNYEMDMKVESHLMGAGIKLSKAEMLQRYGRTEATDPNDVAMIATPVQPQVLESVSAAPVPSDEASQTEVALNGAQIASIISVVKEASAGTIPKARVLPTLKAAFPLIPENVLLSIVRPILSFEPTTLANEETADAAYETAALEALAEARAKNLKPAVDALLDAMAIDDDVAFKAALQKIYDDLPAMIETAGQDKETADLMQRILLGAVQQGKGQK
jgi:Protein of unknown function (DUF935)